MVDSAVAATPEAARTAMAERRSSVNRWATATTMNRPSPMSPNRRKPYWKRNLIAKRPMVALVAV